jgi:hypothetical protein
MVGSFDIFALVHRYLSKEDCSRHISFSYAQNKASGLIRQARSINMPALAANIFTVAISTRQKKADWSGLLSNPTILDVYGVVSF